jgi:hypothetical protein
MVSASHILMIRLQTSRGSSVVKGFRSTWAWESLPDRLVHSEHNAIIDGPIDVFAVESLYADVRFKVLPKTGM